MTKVKELFGINTSKKNVNWKDVIKDQQCDYLSRKCIKNRKSESHIAIGTCTMCYGKNQDDIIICPHRLLEKRQIFIDCLHLLTNHTPGNELHVVSEIQIPGGNVDYFLVSAKNGKVMDFVGIELQTMDTTGTVWPERERFLKEVNLNYDEEIIKSKKTFGMNWKMTAKTILVQLHHKVQTFEHLNKHLVLVLQEPLLNYMKKEFNFSLVKEAVLGESLHFHSYNLTKKNNDMLTLSLSERLSTDAEGMSVCLGLMSEPKIELLQIISKLEHKISEKTLLMI